MVMLSASLTGETCQPTSRRATVRAAVSIRCTSASEASNRPLVNVWTSVTVSSATGYFSRRQVTPPSVTVAPTAGSVGTEPADVPATVAW